MRRFISYLLLSLSLLLGVGVAATPLFTRLNTGREYASGQEIVYRLVDREDSATDIENDKDAASVVAKEMKSRLDGFGVEDYQVVVEGNDTIRVALREQNDTQLTYIRKYLAFSGENFSLAAKDEETRLTQDQVFKDSKAYIVKQNDLVPYVIFPISDSTAVKTLVENAGKGSEEPSGAYIPTRAKLDGEEDSSAEADIFLWANWVEGDTYEKASSDASGIGQKIICSFNHEHIWYEKSAEENTELQFLCGFADSEGNYDASKLKDANQLANYLVSIFNASSYEYDVKDLYVTESASGLTYNTNTTNASVENILTLGTDINIAFSLTLLSALTAIIIASIVLAMFYKISAVAMVTNTVVTTFLSYLVFVLLGATFNIGAIVGGILLSAANLATEIIYVNKFREEVYRGRSIKKANTEASKKYILLTIDFAVILAVVGLAIYLLGGIALRPLGVVLFFGALISVLTNLIIFRLLMWFVTNNTAFQNNYKVFGIEEDKVPNLLSEEEKVVYEGPYANKDFSTKKKPFLLASLIALVIGLASITTFSIIGGGNGLSVRDTSHETALYVSIKGENTELTTADEYKNQVLANILVNDKPVSYSNVEVHNREEYDAETTVTTKYIYFVTTTNQVFNENDSYKYKLGNSIIDASSIEDAFELLVDEIEGKSSSDYILVSSKARTQLVNSPDQGFVMLATSVGLVVACLYLAFRYRPSKALSVLCVSASSTIVTYGVLCLLRFIETTAINSLALPIVMLISLVSSMFYLVKEKELKVENKEELTPELRHTLKVKTVGISASALFIFSIIAGYLGINFFGFGPAAFVIMFLGMVLGVICSTILNTFVLIHLDEFFEKLFGKVRLPKFNRNKRRRERIKLQGKKNSSEPQETIFIGIND